MESKLSAKPSVELIAILQGYSFLSDFDFGPEEIAVYGALGCFEEKSALKLFLEDKDNLPEEKLEKKKERIFEETAGRGHGSVLDQSRFTFSIENLPRIATLQLCLPQYLEHLQQSLRRANANRGFFLPDAIINSSLKGKTEEILNESFNLYEEMKEIGIPGEDARFILPLYTRTNILTTGNARELMHLHHMSRQKHIPSIIQETVKAMIENAKEASPRLMKERENNYEVLAWYPSAQLFALKNEGLKEIIEKDGIENVNAIGEPCGIYLNEEVIERAIKGRDEAELANLEHIHYTFLVRMSLSAFHQAIRQRTWNQSVESIYDAMARKEFVTPPSIKAKEEYREKYEEQNQKMFGLYEELLEAGIPQQEAIGVIPHSLSVWDLMHINGWNAIHSIGKRTCTNAQWEIRGIAGRIADDIKESYPSLGKYAEPQGIIYGRCPESKSCGLCEKELKKENI